MTNADLKKIIINISIVKPAGYNRLRLRDIQMIFNKLKHVLLAIIYEVSGTGTITDKLNVAKVQTILKKKGSKKELSNYRPITLLFVIHRY